MTNIPLWKYESVRQAIIGSVASAGKEGIAFKELSSQVRSRMGAEALEKLGSVGWHTTSVKLEMEVAGELRRLDVKGPQHLVLTKKAKGVALAMGQK